MANSHPTQFQRLHVPVELSGTRLDRCLAQLMPGVSRTRIQAWIAEGAVRVDDRIATKSGVLVQAGALLQVEARERDVQRSTDQASESRRQADASQTRVSSLEAELADMKLQKTDRG
jgi:23S rRNA-/tRNA-specific pseudouridylate synthase